jgi:hypothetical protein
MLLCKTVSGQLKCKNGVINRPVRFDIGPFVDVCYQGCNKEFLYQYMLLRARRGAVGWGTALHAGRSGVRFSTVSLKFLIDLTFRPYYGAGVDSASNRNEYQEYFLGVKAAGA